MLEGCSPWPDEFAERYRALGYWRGETLSDLLRQWSRRSGSGTAIVHDGRELSYAELDQRVDRVAAGFQRHGITAGDRVIVQLPNVPELVIACFALFRIDAKPVFSLLAHRSSELRHLAELSGATGYVGPGWYRGFDYTALATGVMTECPGLRRLFVLHEKEPVESRADGRIVPFAEVDGEPVPTPPADPSDVAFFLLSGGTTALPKLIPRTHDDYAYQIRVITGLLELSPADVYLAVLPAGFNFTWGCPGILGTLSAGGTVILAEDPDPDECFAAIRSRPVTFTSLVPALAQLWLDAVEGEPFGPASLQVIQIGGAPLPREIAERIGPAFGCQLQQVFGMAEGLISMTRKTDAPDKVLATQGRPVSPADEVRIVDSSGASLRAGQTGELLARGAYTLRGYYRAPEHNAKVFTADGFYRTGDLAQLTSDGYLVIEGRLKDVIIRGGNKVSAAEVEEHLLAHPAVDRVAVVPVPDPYVGERICAYIRPAGQPPTLPMLREALQQRGIADYKLPDRLEIVDELPLTGLGKVDKKLLAKQAAAKAGA